MGGFYRSLQHLVVFSIRNSSKNVAAPAGCLSTGEQFCKEAIPQPHGTQYFETALVRSSIQVAPLQFSCDNATADSRSEGWRPYGARVGCSHAPFLPGSASKFVRPIAFAIVMPMQFDFVITSDKSLVRVFRASA